MGTLSGAIKASITLFVFGIMFSGPLLCQRSTYGTINRLEWARTLNYTKSAYHADRQNWSITQGTDGIMYFANHEGLLSFDGTEWNLYRHPDNQIIRAVGAGPKGRIFAGTYEDFGYWERDAYGNMEYISLKGLLKEFNFHNQEIWKILVEGDSVWFQSFNVIFLYHDNQVRHYNSPGVITSFYQIHGRICMIIREKGLYTFAGGEFVPLSDDPLFRDKMIRVLLPYRSDQILVATSDDGIFMFSERDGLKPWRAGISRIMTDRVINRGLIAPGGDVVLGTQLYGIFVFDSTGNFRYNIDQEGGLQNNTVLALHIDKQDHLWAGLDNGIDLVDLESEVSFFRDRGGEIGAVYSVVLHEGMIYAGTNKGLFYSRLTESSEPGLTRLDFSLVTGSESQVWSLEKFDDQVLCGHNDGTFVVEGFSWENISPVSGVYQMRPFHRNGEDYILQGTYTDPVILHKHGGNWVFRNRLLGFNQPSEYIEMDHLGNIWAGHKNKGLYRIILKPDLTSIERVEHYGSDKGLSNDFKVSICRIHGRVVFINEGLFYTYDDLNDTLVGYDRLNKLVSGDEKVHKVIQSSVDEYWFISDKSLTLQRIGRQRDLKLISYPFNVFGNHQIRYYENIRRIDSLRSILCLDNGFALVPHRYPSLEMTLPPPVLKQVAVRGGKKTNLQEIDQGPPSKAIELPYRFNSVSFRYYWPFYGSSKRFSVWLEGLEDEPQLIGSPEVRYDRLPAGEYVFHLSAMDVQDRATSELTWTFAVRSPWYWSGVSKFLYLICFGSMILLIRRYYLRRLRQQEASLNEEKESEIIRMRNEQLRAEVSYKSKELANTTFNIIKKNELLMEIREALRMENPVRVITRLVDRGISSEEDWKVFESNFEQAHEEFLRRIKEKHSSLTPSDLKLCAYLRMNLSTKKIALLLGISTRGVENHRYRLRKKLGLKHDENLTGFLMEF